MDRKKNLANPGEVVLKRQRRTAYCKASTISFREDQPPTFSAAALATAIEAPTPRRPLEEGAAASLAGAATLAAVFAFLPFFFPGSFCLTAYTRLSVTVTPFSFKAATTSFADAPGVSFKTLRISSLLFADRFAIFVAPEW